MPLPVGSSYKYKKAFFSFFSIQHPRWLPWIFVEILSGLFSGSNGDMRFWPLTLACLEYCHVFKFKVYNFQNSIDIIVKRMLNCVKFLTSSKIIQSGQNLICRCIWVTRDFTLLLVSWKIQNVRHDFIWSYFHKNWYTWSSRYTNSFWVIVTFIEKLK